MSSYYHSFQIGFNWFYVAGPLCLAMGILLDAMTRLYLGWRTVKGADYRMLAFRLRKDESRETIKFHEIIKTIYWIATTATFMVMVWAEARDGILQLFDNSLARYESGAWSIFWLLASMVGIFLIYSWLGYESLSHGADWTGMAICFAVDFPIILFHEATDKISRLDAKRRQKHIHALDERRKHRERRMAARMGWYEQLTRKAK